MAILYIKNENGEFETVPAIKGEKGDPGEIPTVDFAAMGLTELVVDSDGDTFTITQEQFEQLAQQATTAPIKTNIAINNGLFTVNFGVVLNGWYTESYPPGGKTVEFYGIGYMEPDYGVDIAIKAVNSGAEYYLTGFAKTISNGAGGGDNVVVVDIKINEMDEPIQLEDEIFNVLTSDTAVAIVKNAGISEDVNTYLYKSNEGMDDSLTSLKSQVVYLSSPQYTTEFNAYFSFRLTIDKSQKTATMHSDFVFCVPSTESAGEGDILKLVDGIPTWQSLPIYAGEVE